MLTRSGVNTVIAPQEVHGHIDIAPLTKQLNSASRPKITRGEPERCGHDAPTVNCRLPRRSAVIKDGGGIGCDLNNIAFLGQINQLIVSPKIEPNGGILPAELRKKRCKHVAHEGDGRCDAYPASGAFSSLNPRRTAEDAGGPHHLTGRLNQLLPVPGQRDSMVERCRSFTPDACSSRAIAFETLAVDIPSWRPASASEPASTTATKHRSWENEISGSVSAIRAALPFRWRSRQTLPR